MAISQRRLTLAEFLELPEQKPALEYETGAVKQKVSPKAPHSRLQFWLCRLFDSSDSQFGVDRRHASAGQLDALALDRGESGEHERQAVAAGFQIDDAVLAAPIRDDGARLLDERRARRFDVHAGQDGAGRIADDAGDGWLGK